MGVYAVPYYEAKCDGCGCQAEFGDFTAFRDSGDVAENLRDNDWSHDGETWHCPDCPLIESSDD